MTTLVLASAFIGLLFLGLPAGFAMLVASIATLLLVLDVPGSVIPTRMFQSLNSFSLMAVPFFVLAGELMNSGGITRRLVVLAMALVGHLRGGLAQVNVVASMLFSGLSGSATADASALGSMLIPAMQKAGYPDSFSVGVTASSATIGPIIPPSITMIIYSGITGISVGALFLAGILPGLMVGIALMLAVHVFSSIRQYPRAAERASARQILRAFWDTSLALLTPVIIIGGVMSGVFTATESGAVACIYAFMVGRFVYREFGWRDIVSIMNRAAVTTAVAMFVLSAASLVGYIVAREGAGRELVELITAVTDHPLGVLFLVAAILILVGMVLESLATMLIFVPLLAPLAVQMQYDPIHFAIIVILCILVGTITPPVGILLYICCSIANLQVSRAEVWPFAFVIMSVIALIIVFPAIVTVVPSLYSR